MLSSVHMLICTSTFPCRIYFTPNTVLSSIALVGLPGTAGFINIVSDSQILGLSIVLQIPFQLSQCPLGYYDPPMMNAPKEEVIHNKLNYIFCKYANNYW